MFKEVILAANCRSPKYSRLYGQHQSRFLCTPRMRDGAVVVANDLTHLIPHQPWTALTSAAIPDELDKAKKHEHDSGNAKDNILEDLGFRLESKEIHGRASGWDAADVHPLLVAPDSSTLNEDLCRKNTLCTTFINTHLCFVDEFGQRNVSVVAKDMNIFESLGTVLELDA